MRSSAVQSVQRAVEPAVPFDVARIRADFPILSREVYGKPLVYLDSAASAQKPRAVIDAERHCYEFEYANVHRGAHYLSNAATEKFEATRDKARAFLNARDRREIVFTRGATEGINLVASSFLRPRIQAGDEIVLSVMEHHSNIVPWHMLREEKGAVLRWAPVEEDGSFSLEAYAELLGPRTKFVAITHMSNVLGTATPIRDIVRLAHERGIPVLVDGCQAAVHMPIDVQSIGCDFYVFSGHKLYGPNGAGVLYGRLERLMDMPPYQGGGEMIREVSYDRITYAEPPHRFEAGTPAIAPVIGLGAALDYLAGLDRGAAMAHEAGLLVYATERLQQIDGLRIVGTTPDKGSIIAFTLEGVHPHDVATIVDREGVAIRAGHHCAQALMRRFDLVATSRASFAIYNTREEVDALISALIKCKELFG
jgi:cysteine desulfurase/selenocysteine lyase